MSVRSTRRTPLINGAVVDTHVAVFDGTTGAIKDGGVPAGTGTVTNSGTLTANQLIIGAGTTVVTALGTLGTTTTVLHGNAGGAPTFGQVSLTADVSGDLPFSSLVQASGASVLVGRGSAAGAGDFQEITLGTGLSMSGTALSSTSAADAKRQITFVTGDGSQVISTGLKTFCPVDFSGTITGVRVLSIDAAGPATSGSITIDIWKKAIASAYPPTVTDTIINTGAGGTKPNLSTSTNYYDTTLSHWTTSVTAGDCFAFKVDGTPTGVTKVLLALEIQPS